MAFTRRCGDNLFDGLGKPHIEHLIGLIQHQSFEGRQIAKPLLDQIQQTAGRSNDDIDTFLQRIDLMKLANAPEDRGNAEVQMATKYLEPIGNLADEFTRRSQNEHAGSILRCGAWVSRQTMEQRQREGRRLARSRLSHSQQIAALQKQRDGLCLDGGGRLVTSLGKSLENSRREGEFVKCHGHDEAAPPAHKIGCALAGI